MEAKRDLRPGIALELPLLHRTTVQIDRQRLRLPVALLTIALLGATLAACGDTRKVADLTATGSRSIGSAASHTTSATPEGYVREDGDKDYDDGPHPTKGQRDNGSLFAIYPGRAGRTEARAITTVVKRYYAASAAGEGAGACALLSAGLAKGLAADHAQPTQSARTTCAAAISPLLAQQHRHLIAEDPTTMMVTSVHLNGKLALVVLGFKRAPEGQILLEREGHTWKIDALFDNEMT